MKLPLRMAAITFGAFFLVSAPALARVITTVAGTGIFGYTGDGGPAIDATMRNPKGLSVDGAGNVYFAENQSHVIRRIDAQTGIITTVAGNGTAGFGGDGGPATQASMFGPNGLFVDQPGNILIADQGNNRIRRVDAQTGIIQTFAGNGASGFSGNGGPATQAALSVPTGVCADLDGNVYIADFGNFRIRRVDAGTGIITTFAGNGLPFHNGDGGPATSANLMGPERVAVDFANNVYIVQHENNARVRRVDGASHIITTVAGGGPTIADAGIATDMNLGQCTYVAIDGVGNLLLSTVQGRGQATNDNSRLWYTHADSMTTIAGTGPGAYAGDGGDALLAQLWNPYGAAVNEIGEIFLSDLGNQRIRKIGLDPQDLDELIVTAQTLQGLLDALRSLQGSLVMASVAGRTSLIAHLLESIGLDFIVTGNGDLVLLETPGLLSIGGVLRIENNLVLERVAMPGLTVIGGDLFVVNNPSATGQMDLGGLQSVGGSLSVGNNPVADAVDLDHLSTVGGSVSVGNNPVADAVDLDHLSTVGGDVTVDDNTSATEVDLGGLQSVGGDLTVTDNGSATVNLSSLTTVTGSVLLGLSGQSTINLNNASIGGNLTVYSVGATLLAARTAAGTSSLTFQNDATTMSSQLAPGTFTAPVPFTITRVPPEDLAAAGGVSIEGAGVQPLEAYTFSFGGGSLNHPATLSFTVDLDLLDSGTRGALETALAQGKATLAVKDDAPGSPYLAYPVCQSGQTPSGNTCAEITYPDPSKVVFTGSATHFSTWAVAIVSAGAVAVGKQLPSAFALHPSQPNPFTQSTTFGFDLPRRSAVSVRVFDVRGRLVRTLVEGASFEPGSHRLTWDGTLQGGRSAGPGVYFYALEAGGFRDVKRIVFLR